MRNIICTGTPTRDEKSWLFVMEGHHQNQYKDIAQVQVQNGVFNYTMAIPNGKVEAEILFPSVSTIV
jgi:hypothetical protein